MIPYSQADEIRLATLSYLRSRYNRGDLSWHPLFQAVRELWAEAVNALSRS